MANERLLYIDLLKIIGILLIIAYHLSTVYPQLNLVYMVYYPFGINLGYAGVAMFVFASGAGLTAANKRPWTINEIYSFYKSRIARIYPAFWMAVIFIMTTIGPRSYSLWDLFTTFTGFQALLGYWSGGVQVVFWFVGLVMTLYLLYPLLSRMIDRNSEMTVLTSAAISVISMAVIIILPWKTYGLPISAENLNAMWYWFPLCWLIYFAMGMYVAKKSIFAGLKNKNKTAMFMADLSFYIYLIHAAFLGLAIWNPMFFVLATICVAIMLYSFDMQIKKIDLQPFVAPLTSFLNKVYKAVSRYVT